MADEMRGLERKRTEQADEGIDETLDRGLLPGGAAAGARQIGPNCLIALGERHGLRRIEVRGAAQAVDQNHRRALPVELNRHALDHLGRHAAASAKRATGFSRTPMPAISMRTTSPCLRYLGGLNPIPTPAGVPVAMISPGASVRPLEMVSIRVGTSKISAFVLEFWRRSPLTQQRTDVSDRSISSALTSQGPMGQKLSWDLPISHCLWRLWRSRAVTSLTMV